jgi:hypothetical protein
MNKRSVKKSRRAKASRSAVVRKVRKTAARKSVATKSAARKASAPKSSARKTTAHKSPARQVARRLEHSIAVANGTNGAVSNGTATLATVSVMDVLARTPGLQTHKYHVGQTVFFTSSPITRPGASGSYRVVKLLPSDGDDYQYRIKNPGEAFERVAKESQLEVEL